MADAASTLVLTAKRSVLDDKFRRTGSSYSMNPKPRFRHSDRWRLSCLIHEVLRKFKDAQFIISTHSPILLGYPNAQILSLDDRQIHEIQ